MQQNKKPWARGFSVARATHEEVKKTPEQLEQERRRKKAVADIDERKFLKELGLYM